MNEYKLPGPFMELHKEIVPAVYEAWAAQMQQAYQAGRDAMREEAFRACVDIANAPSNCVLGVALNCADKIKELK